jgi:hypothetical protein
VDVVESERRREHRSLRISILKTRYQETTNERGLRRLIVCCSEL